jgi:uncharacterized repeat protein (TIGR03803 family)
MRSRLFNFFVALALLAFPAHDAIAQFTTLYDFDGGSDGETPFGGVILDPTGAILYGTTSFDGTGGSGTVFAIHTDGTDITALYSFTGGSDGGVPYDGLVLDATGTILYGTTSTGGSGSGTVFAYDTTAPFGTGFSTLYTFSGGSDGGTPEGGLILDATGSILYGTTEYGGNGTGTVFSVQTDGSTASPLTPLYSFTGGADGADPVSGLILDPTGATLYGTTAYGGNDYGTVFSVQIDGSTVAPLTPLYSFTGGADGNNPNAGLVLDPTGAILYGTTANGGSSFAGVVFAVNADGSTVAPLAPLYTFTDGSDGDSPHAALCLSGNILYGTASYGGNSGDGTVFALDTDGTDFTTIFAFGGGSEGVFPYGGLILSANTLYGTASQGGNSGDGTVFSFALTARVTPSFSNLTPSQSNPYGTPYITLYGTLSAPGPVYPAQGETITVTIGGNAQTTTINDATGDFFFSYNSSTIPVSGTPYSIIYSYAGDVSLNPASDSSTTLTIDCQAHTSAVYTFTGASDGANPQYGGILDPTGSILYSTVNSPGGNGCSLFSFNITTSVLATLYAFGLGNPPDGRLISSVDGKTLYGVTFSGGDAAGTVFSFNVETSVFTTLYTFTGDSDGYWPIGQLVLSGNTLYGACHEGGNGNGDGNGDGTVFAVKTDGSTASPLTPLYTFNGNVDGFGPLGGMVLSVDGSTLYGTCEQGGPGTGTVFAVKTDGSTVALLAPLYTFTGGSDGGFGGNGLVLSADGSTLYGTAQLGGSAPIYGGFGTVFAVKTDGSTVAPLTPLHTFTDGSDGAYPSVELLLFGNVLYGVAGSGGSSGFGTVYAVDSDGTDFKVLHTFASGCDGDVPEGMVLSGNTLYGTTYEGGMESYGTVFGIPLAPRVTPSFANLTPSQSTPFGTTSVTLSGTVRAAGSVYPAQGETITVTIAGNAQTTTINDASGDFSFSYNPSAIPGSCTANTIAYSYAGDVSLVAATDSSTALTVVVSLVAGPNSLAAAKGQSASVPVAAVLLGDSGQGALSITAVSSPTVGGASVTLANGDITYTPAAGFTGSDTIDYTLSDNCATGPGTIAVNVAAPGSAPTAQATAPAGQTASLAVPFTATQGGLTATLNNVSGSQSVTVTAKLYSGNPIHGISGFGLGTTYLDLEVSGATAGDSMTVYFYSPHIVPAPALEYYTGADWENVYSDLPPPGIPAASLQNGLWQYTVVFDNSSTPAITGLTGTVIALATTFGPTLTATQSGNSVIISWPDTGNYILQQNSSLSIPAGWAATGYSTNTSNGTNSITITSPAGKLFFRLANP